MKATVEEINSVQRRLMVVISSDVVNKAFDSAYLKLKKKAKVQGFRPGKVPLSIIKKLYQSNVSYEVGESLINEHLFSAIDTNGVKPVARPFVEVKDVPVADKDYEFSAVIDVLPSIAFEEKHKSLNIDSQEYSANEETLNKELEELRRKHAKTSPIDDSSTKAQEGHLAVISHTASIDGKELKEMNVKSAPVVLGKKEILPELETAIIGLKKKETCDVDIKVPDEYSEQELAGKTVHFKITLDDLLKVDYPELNDDFAKDLNQETLDSLKTDIMANLESTAEKMTKQELEKNLLSALSEAVQFEVPPAMVDQVIDGMISDLKFKDQKEKDSALKNKEFRERFQDDAKKTARNTILLWELIKTENLSVSDDEITEHVKKFAPSEAEDHEQQVQMTVSQYGEKIKENLVFEKAIQFLADHSKVNKKSVVL